MTCKLNNASVRFESVYFFCKLNRCFEQIPTYFYDVLLVPCRIIVSQGSLWSFFVCVFRILWLYGLENNYSRFNTQLT